MALVKSMCVLTYHHYQLYYQNACTLAILIIIVNVRAHLLSIINIMLLLQHYYHYQHACSPTIIILPSLWHYYRHQHACSPTLTISEPVAVAVCFNIYLCFRHLFQTSCHGQKLKTPL